MTDDSSVEPMARQSNGDGALVVVVAAALAASLPLAWLGRFLSAHTHHRPLGAVTFALVALMTVCAFMLIGYRAVFGEDRRRVKLRFRGLIVVACVSLAGSVALALQ